MARDSGNRINTANSIGLLVLLVAVLVWVLIPPFWLKVASFIVAECGFILFALKSDWTHSWGRVRQWFAGLLIAAVLASAGTPQFYDQWKREHPKRAMQSTLPATPLPPPPAAVAPANPSRPQENNSQAATKDVFSALSDRARKLSVEMQAFFVSSRPPDNPHDPSENDSYARAWDKYCADTSAEFGKRFGAKLFGLVGDLKTLGLADVQLGLDISMMGVPLSGLSTDIPIRLNFVADHLGSMEERAILRVPLTRRLTPNDARRLNAWLRPRIGKILVGYSDDEADAKDYAADFSRVFRAAGWTVVVGSPPSIAELRFSSVVPDAATMGLTIIDVKAPPSIVMNRLMPALKEIGIVPNYFRKDRGELRTDVDAYLLVGAVPHAL